MMRTNDERVSQLVIEYITENYLCWQQISSLISYPSVFIHAQLLCLGYAVHACFGRATLARQLDN